MYKNAPKGKTLAGTLGGSLLAGLIGLCGCTAALAAEPPGDAHPPLPELLLDGPGGPDTPPPPGAAPGPGPRQQPGLDIGGPPHEVIQTLAEIEQLYRQQGKTREVVALYQDVLHRTKDPLVRHFAYEAIAHAQLQPDDADKAVATLKQSLDESLQRLDQPPPPEAHGKGM